jgi:hypothetical protein
MERPVAQEEPVRQLPELLVPVGAAPEAAIMPAAEQVEVALRTSTIGVVQSAPEEEEEEAPSMEQVMSVVGPAEPMVVAEGVAEPAVHRVTRAEPAAMG